jgi:hypothetical protein
MVKSYRVTFVTIYLFLMAGLLYIKPDLVFGREGRIRPFGTREKEATILPLWLVIFFLAVLSYCLTVYWFGFRLR